MILDTVRPPMKNFIFCLLISVCQVGVVQAGDAYFVRFRAFGNSIMWADDILFYNTNASPVTVRFIGVSNGESQHTIRDLPLPSHKTVSAQASETITQTWEPNIAIPTLWVVHLDVPPGVIAESRDEFYFYNPLPTPHVAVPRGKVSMPIFRSLVAPGEQQVHLGTDLSGTDSRVNVGIYNAGGLQASAVVEIRRTCDDTPIATTTINVPPNTVLQSVAVAIARNDSCGGASTPPWVYMVSVTVDQPSFTFISNVSSNGSQPPSEVGLIPVVTLAVTKNERF